MGLVNGSGRDVRSPLSSLSPRPLFSGSSSSASEGRPQTGPTFPSPDTPVPAVYGCRGPLAISTTRRSTRSHRRLQGPEDPTADGGEPDGQDPCVATSEDGPESTKRQRRDSAKKRERRQTRGERQIKTGGGRCNNGERVRENREMER